MKAYLLLADGFEEVEALTTADVLKRGGFEVVLVSTMGTAMVRGSHDFKLAADEVIGSGDSLESSCADGDIVILPGGMPGTTNLGADKGVTGLIKAYAEAGKYVAAICAAPSVLGLNGLLQGKTATCFPGFEDKLIGAKHENRPAIIDGKIITGRSMGSALDFGLAIVEAMQGAEAAKKLEASLYR